MKAVLLFLGALGLGVGVLVVASPAKGQALLSRASGYFQPTPRANGGTAPAPTDGAAAPALGGAATTSAWRRLDRTASRAYETGDFAAAAAGWTEAAGKASASEATRLRQRADRANVFRLLSEGAVPVGDVDPVAAEAEYRRRLEALKVPTGGAYLELADWAAARGLRGHLAFLFERAFERKDAADNAVQQRVSLVVKRRRAESVAPPSREILDALIRELPGSEAADIALEETGAAPGRGAGGVGGVSRRSGVGITDADRKKLEDADRFTATGDAEYKAAVPGSKDVNKHRRAALDAYTKARSLFEEVDRGLGTQAHHKEIHDLNRNIAELRKDLPVGK